jgi:hypothetical protein
MQSRSFFRWLPTAIMLWVFGVLFGLAAALNVFLASFAMSGRLHDAKYPDPQKLARFYYIGAVQDGLMAVLCLAGWHFMRRRTHSGFVIGGCVVAVALAITVQRWVHAEMLGLNPLPWLEPLAVWPFLIYPVMHAVRESKVRNV